MAENNKSILKIYDHCFHFKMRKNGLFSYKGTSFFNMNTCSICEMCILALCSTVSELIVMILLFYIRQIVEFHAVC